MTRAGWHTRSGSVVVGNHAAIRAHNNAISAQIRAAHTALEAENLSEAERVASALLQRDPGNGNAHLVLGVCAQRNQRLELSEQHFRLARRALPDSPEAAYGLAMVLSEHRQFEAALPFVEEVLALDDLDARYHFRLGIILEGLGRGEASRRAMERSIELDPNQSMSRNALANYLRERGELVAAIAQYRAAAHLDRLEPSIYGNAAVSFQELGDVWRSVRLGRQSLALNPFNLTFFSNLLLALNYAHDVSQAQLARAHAQYGALAQFVERPTQAGAWIPHERLRLGLMSPDLRQHPVAAFVEPLLRAGADCGMDIFCYSDSPMVDEVTKRLSEYPVSWRQIDALQGDAVLRVVRGDSLDVLLDLAGHTGSNRRLSLFNARLATLQGTWLGYTFSTGVAEMDIRITDCVSDPEALDDPLYSEKLLRLPSPFLNFQPPDVAPALDSRRPGPVRFVCLNNVSKMSAPMLAAWVQILERIPDATLTLKSRLFADEASADQVRERFRRSGIDTARVRMDPTLASVEAHLRYYDAADIALDTFPYNGTTTTCEALWMGVPVVSLRGTLHAGRVGASLLSAVGLAETLLVDDVDAYVDKAVELARDIDGTWALREQIIERVRSSKLVDAGDFATRLKNALTAELQARHPPAKDAAHRGPQFCFVIGMPRAGATWVFNVVRDLFATAGPVVSLGLLGPDDIVSPHADQGTAKHIGLVQQANASVADILADGKGVAIIVERVLPDALIALARSQGRDLTEVCEDEFIDLVIETRDFWREQPHTWRLQFDAIVQYPREAARQLRHWLGLDTSDAKLDVLVARWSADAVRSRAKAVETQTQTDTDAVTLLSKDHIIGSENKNYLALLGTPTYAAVTARANAREDAHAQLLDFARAVPAVPVRIGPAREDSYEADVWLQVAPDVRAATTFITLEQSDWFEVELGFMRRYLQQGMRMLDVGANHGVYALSAAQVVGIDGYVVAVEPGIEPAARLLRASLLPGGARIDVAQVAVGSRDAHGYLAGDGASELGHVVEHGDGPRVEIVRLDALAARHGLVDVDYIKLDVEGAEVAAIAGGQELLTLCDPLVQLEILAGQETSLEAMRALQDLGFEPYQVVPGLNALRPFKRDADGYCLNLIALKPTRAEALLQRGLLFHEHQTQRPISSQHTVDEAFALWPYAAALETNWRRALEVSSSARDDVVEGISWYVEACATTDAPGQAWRALERAAECFRRVSDERPLQRLSLATILLDMGMRERAIAAMRPLVKQLSDLPDPTSEPFLCPLADYRQMQPGHDSSRSDWIEALIRATFVRIASHSALYLTDQARELLQGMKPLDVMDDRSKRTLTLLEALDASQAPGPVVTEWTSQVISGFESLPGWLKDRDQS